MAISEELELKMRAEHRAKYEDWAQKLGLETLKQTVLAIAPQAEIEECLQYDRNLNNIDLRRWDGGDFTVKLLVQGYVRQTRQTVSWSLSMTVCVLKHVAKYHVAGWTAEQDDAAPIP